MKAEDRYLMFVRWSEEDQSYVGYCPDLFPAGGVCHGASAVEAFSKLADIVSDTTATALQEGLALPPALTRPMREIEIAA
jgi:predicted RNase H-like HicB family nuclease